MPSRSVETRARRPRGAARLRGGAVVARRVSRARAEQPGLSGAARARRARRAACVLRVARRRLTTLVDRITCGARSTPAPRRCSCSIRGPASSRAADWTRLVRAAPRALARRDARRSACRASSSCRMRRTSWRSTARSRPRRSPWIGARIWRRSGRPWVRAKALQGNLDPAILLAGPDATRRAARALLARVPARGHVVNLGHGIMPDTPLESVHVLIDDRARRERRS